MKINDCKSDEESLRYCIHSSSLMLLVLVGISLSSLIYFTMLVNLFPSLKLSISNIAKGEWLITSAMILVSIGILSSIIIEKLMSVICERNLNNKDNGLSMTVLSKLHMTLGNIRAYYCMLGLLMFLASLLIASSKGLLDASHHLSVLLCFNIIGIFLIINAFIFVARIEHGCKK